MGMNGRGGARPGAGRPPGSVSAKKRELMALAKEHTQLALDTIVDICRVGESEAAKLTAANMLLNRGFTGGRFRVSSTPGLSAPTGTSRMPKPSLNRSSLAKQMRSGSLTEKSSTRRATDKIPKRYHSK